jgi:hemolysin activation/secretion protein
MEPAHEPGPSAEPTSGQSQIPGISQASPTFVVTNYQVRGNTRIATNVLDSILSKHTGTNLTELAIVKAAWDVLLENRSRGYPPISIAVAEQQITNGFVTMNAFKGNSEVLVSGRRYSLPKPAEDTNAPVRFPVTNYEITGDTLLSIETLTALLTKHTGTNITVKDVVRAASDLQLEYRTRGYPTVNVTVPPQQITNGIVKIRVFIGQLSDIAVTDNRYFSSNNVMRALPSLRTNEILNGPILQAELDRANANQDRQIYPRLEPGEAENTTRLVLSVKDRLPLHGKIELNNQSSPGTPELRLNSSAAYNNLWQFEHSLGLQYSFSPEELKAGKQWAWYDQPLVANYSGFYRLPLGNPESVESTVAVQPGSFGFDEATRRFRLPQSSGRAEVNFYASRSTIDTGVLILSDRILQDIPGVIRVREEDVQQDLTINENLGARLSVPMRVSGTNLQSSFSLGMDFKKYSLVSYKTNNFFFTTISVDQEGRTNVTHSEVSSEVPTTFHKLDYLPLSIRFDVNQRDVLGVTTFGLGIAGNVWHSDNRTNIQRITGSKDSSGIWVIVNPSISRDFVIRTNWMLAIRAEGQWTGQPLISNEQFGNGGIASIRGYREGEVFGDTGWRINAELKTPPQIVGIAYAGQRMTVRGSLYMDYGETYLLDPNGRKAATPLWGTGIGAVASIGTHWDVRLLCSFPLLASPTTSAYQPLFNFSLSGQF